jgi:ABC-type Fe3+-hydroxamate transport system substrate-binding protein
MKRLSIVLIISAMWAFSACSSGSDAASNASNENKAVVETVTSPEGDTVQVNIPEVPDPANSNAQLKVPDPMKAGKPVPMARPAPEDSEFTATLTDVATEIRTFRNHPQIRRVEKVSDGKKSTVKVFLVNGKTAEFDGAKLPSLIQASSHQILELAGVEPVQRGIVDRPDSEKKN